MMYNRLFNAGKTFLVFGALFNLTCLTTFTAPADQIVDSKPHAFGERKKGDTSERPRLDLPFTADANSTEVSLQISHRDVMLPVFVLVNDKQVGEIGRSYKGSGSNYVAVPAGVLKQGA